MNTKLTLEYWTDEGWYIGRLKEIPGIFSQGETIKELEENIIDAYKLIMEDMKDDIIPIADVNVKEIRIELWKEKSSFVSWSILDVIWSGMEGNMIFISIL